MIHLENTSKVYSTPRGPVNALDHMQFEAREGEFVVVRGPSGSGKTTLLLTLGGMLRPSQGQVKLLDQDLYAMPVQTRSQFRAENIGFVFQMFHLIPYLNVLENVLMAGGAVNNKPDTSRAHTLLQRLGISERETHIPAELSAGERQRVAIARALLNQPKVILADEPTGNLDPENEKHVMKYLSEFHQQRGTVIVVTHGTSADQYADRIVRLKDGKIVDHE